MSNPQPTKDQEPSPAPDGASLLDSHVCIYRYFPATGDLLLVQGCADGEYCPDIEFLPDFHVHFSGGTAPIAYVYLRAGSRPAQIQYEATVQGTGWNLDHASVPDTTHPNTTTPHLSLQKQGSGASRYIEITFYCLNAEEEPATDPTPPAPRTGTVAATFTVPARLD